MDVVTGIIWVAWIAVGFVVLYKMAPSRRRSPIGWGIFEALTSLIALIVIGPARGRDARTS